MRLARRIDSAVLVVLNVQVGMKTYHSVPSLSLCDWLRESFTFFFAILCQVRRQIHKLCADTECWKMLK